MKKHVELLAPVGSKEALVAAIQNGANAVYLGGKLFNARHYASNFNNEELKEAVTYAHLRNVKVFVTVNILVDDSEINDIIDYIRYLYEIDVDAIIVQDLGFAYLVSKIFPELDLHASTQMTINNLHGVRFLKNMGFSRIVLARETPLDEIKYINSQIDIELEAFIHGALCMSYSGQCLMSSMIGGRSGNRGTCAQPCRMKYSIIDRDGNLLKDWDQLHVLSTKDLNTIEHIDELVDSGISSLKIEGRMKRPEYVATVVSSYRKALDNSRSITKEDKKNIEQIFNRGFTKGLTFGDFGRTFISHERPDNRGIYLGKVIRVDKYKVYVQLEEDIEQGDGLEFQLKNGEYKGIKAPFDAKRGSTIHLEKTGHIEKDSAVYKTSSQSLLDKAKASYTDRDIKYPVDMELDINIGEKAKLILIYKDKVIEVSSDKEVERSQKIAITKTKIVEQLSKLGDTTYYLNNININLEEGAFIPVSLLNQLRRDAISQLDDLLKVVNDRDKLDDEDFNELKSRYFKFNNTTNKTTTKKLTMKLSNINQFNQIDLNKVDRIYFGFENELEEAVIKAKALNVEAYFWTDKILYEKGLKKIGNILERINDFDGISVSNLGTLQYVKDRFDIKIHGDIGLNASNSYTIDFLKGMNLNSITLSPELNISQIKNIWSNIGGNLEGIVYGYLPVMITRNCPMAIVKGCKNDDNCKSCNFAKGYGLKDRMGVVFRMDRNEGYSTIYNSVPLMVLDKLESITNAGVDLIRLDFTNETNNVARIQSMYYDYLNNNIDINIVKDFVESFKQDNSITNGHYFRGIL